MVNTSTKGQASPNAHFFHVTFHQGDKKWYALEVHDGKRKVFNTENEALEQVRGWINEVKQRNESSYVSVHDMHGKIRETKTF